VSVRLRPVRDDELPAWLESARRFYVDDLVVNGGLTKAEAEEKAARDHGALFPGGRPGEGSHVLVVEDEAGAPIGRLWFAERPFGVWLYEIELDPSVRGRGLGRETMRAFEEQARALGAEKIVLNVFAGNEVARSLYRSLGYAEESVHMAKRL
jgi:ribosomal protein S18 acetylase RimI-like enzyme